MSLVVRHSFFFFLCVVLIFAACCRTPLASPSECSHNYISHNCIGHNYIGHNYRTPLVSPSECSRQPLVLCFHDSHFMPCVAHATAERRAERRLVELAFGIGFWSRRLIGDGVQSPACFATASPNQDISNFEPDCNCRASFFFGDMTRLSASARRVVVPLCTQSYEALPLKMATDDELQR